MAADILRELAESMNNTAKILIKLAEISESAAKENTDFEEISGTEMVYEVTITLEEVRAVLAEKSRMGMTSAVKNLLGEYGADKLSAVDSKYYAEIIQKAEGFNNGT